jgi:hypothetical protein
MIRVHALARWPHLAEHIHAIHRHLDDGLRGETLTIRNPTLSHTKHWGRNDVVLVAGYPDIAAAGGRRCVMIEHGASQTYAGITNGSDAYYHPAPGGENRHPANVVGYIGPRQDVIDAWGRPGFAAGCPVVDPYELFSPERVCAISWHWNGALPHKVGVPEAGTALAHYLDRLPAIIAELKANGWEVLGHRHPRFNHLASVWRNLGVREAPIDEVRRRAQLLICDNSSVMAEMLHCGRRVIALNCPEYRRDVEHGLRFWSHVPGQQVDGPDELIDLIREDSDNMGVVDLKVPEYIYGRALSDGLAGMRSAVWLTGFLG